MRHLYALVLLGAVCLTSSASAMAGALSTLSGHVRDRVNGEPIVGANIYLPLLKQGAVSGEDGRYQIDQLPAVRTTIQVSYVGHQTIVETIDLRATSVRDFVMEENNAMLTDVVVTGLTGQARADRSPSPVAVVSPQELHAVASTNIIDAVAHQPGVSQVTTGAAISKPVIRGLGYNRIVTVVDGIRQEGQQWGDEHGIEVDGGAVHAVEILKGPASLMYGSDAMAGVLVLREAPVAPQGRTTLNVGTEYQSNSHLTDYTLNFAGNRRGWVWDWRWSGKRAGEYRNKADGRVTGSQFRERALTAMTGVNRGWGYSHLKLSYYNLRPGLIEGERDVATGRLLPSEAFQKVSHYRAVLDNSFVVSDGSLRAVVGYQQNRRREYEAPGELGLDFRLHTVNYDAHYQSAAEDEWKWAAGLSGMWQRSENLGTEYLIPAYRLFDVGAFASTTRQWETATLSGGVRYDVRRLHSFALYDGDYKSPQTARFTDFSRTFSGLTGSLGAVFNVTSSMNIRINASHGFRAPNLSELGSNGEHEGTFRYEIGNQQLAPERSWQFDLGADYSSDVVSCQIALFANHISNYIFLERLDGNNYQYQQGTARLCGVEALIDIHPVEQLHFENTFSYVNARQLHQPESSRWLPLTPAPRWTSNLRYDIVRDGRTVNNLFVALGLECYLRQNHVHTAGDTETATPSYTLLSLTSGTEIRYKGRHRATLYLTCTNLGNRAYQSHLSRLKYAEDGAICNAGRSLNVKLLIPIQLQ